MGSEIQIGIGEEGTRNVLRCCYRGGRHRSMTCTRDVPYGLTAVVLLANSRPGQAAHSSSSTLMRTAV